MRTKQKKAWIYIHTLIIILIIIMGFLFINKLNQQITYTNYKHLNEKVHALEYSPKGPHMIAQIKKLEKSALNWDLENTNKVLILKKIKGLEVENTVANKVQDFITKAKVTLDERDISNAEKNIKLLTSYDKKKFLSQLNEIKRLSTQKWVALTFDDGPNPATTPHLLDILKSNHIKATFFVLGQEAQLSPELVKREATEGHEVGTHTWDHADLLSCSPKEQKEEITKASRLVEKITGQKQTIFRPPYGNFNSEILSLTSLSAINWSIDTNDWRYTSSEPVIENAVNDAHDGSIILLHDIHSWSVNAVPEIIKELKDQNYKFVTVSELLKKEEGGIKQHHVYYGQ